MLLISQEFSDNVQKDIIFGLFLPYLLQAAREARRRKLPGEQVS